jgi:hypothetical protein
MRDADIIARLSDDGVRSRPVRISPLLEPGSPAAIHRVS